MSWKASKEWYHVESKKSYKKTTELGTLHILLNISYNSRNTWERYVNISMATRSHSSLKCDWVRHIWKV